MTSIATQLDTVVARIRSSCHQSNRKPDGVKLLAVSKRFKADAVQQAFAHGQRAFGENYVQEGVEKIQQLAHLPLEWHFIGPIQSNKTKDIAANFAWVHTVEREKIARRLNDQRPADMPPLNVLLQVNVSNDPAKSGILVEQIDALAQCVAEQPNLRLRGLMTIPAVDLSPEQLAQDFNTMRMAFERLQQGFDSCDTLSMGMSGDLELAIANGSTMVRIGTAIFGQRTN
ncbi:YggS family pyridoxal phosphate-dependent enzyme [Salinibius halmophilus]|uniref:YggS family pyridoxal phosphate-dependent enzyme n=1 Tax=Salinibius halmophilus TaxID=1853216 RepID=UPI000E6627DE|nr:YggS family pyridoxal phosphate-dependent enzyme [Salinibius halmophilus]